MSNDKTDVVLIEERKAKIRADLEQIKLEVLEACWDDLLTGSDESYGRAKAAFNYILHEYEGCKTTDPESSLMVRECIFSIRKSRCWWDVIQASKFYENLVAADAAENAAHAAKRAIADDIEKICEKFCKGDAILQK